MRNIVEDFDPSTNVEGGSIDINDEAVVDAINRNISSVTASACVTPYVALEKVRKILAYYKIFLPQTVFLEGDEGNEVFEISQFGEKFGVTNDGEFKEKNSDGLYLYFEWMTNDDGMIDIFSEIVDEEELDELLADFDDEAEEDENDDSDGAEPTHDMYKASNMREETKLGSYNVARMKKTEMDPDIRKGWTDYKGDQNEKRMSNAVKTTWMSSSNPTYRIRGRMMDRQEIDSDAKKDATRDKFVGQQNTRDIRRNPPITAKEEKNPLDTVPGPYLKTVPPKTKEKRHNEIAKLARRAARAAKRAAKKKK